MRSWMRLPTGWQGLRAVLSAWCCALAVGACAPASLRPARDARVDTDAPLAATAEDSRVRVVVEPGAWSANPRNLDQEILPLKVTIENNSNEPVRVRYADFTLAAERGVQYTPLPPLAIEGSVTETSRRPVAVTPHYGIRPYYSYQGFVVAPWYGPYYEGTGDAPAGIAPWSYPWAYDPTYYDTYYPRWLVDLPTPDMLARALPEGIVEPGGRVTGFMYFPRITASLDRVTFQANLKDGAHDDQTVASVRLPFEVS